MHIIIRTYIIRTINGIITATIRRYNHIPIITQSYFRIHLFLKCHVPAKGFEPLMSVPKTDALPLGYAGKMMSDRVVYGANLENWCALHA